MKKIIFLIVSVSFLFTILYSRNADAAIMEDYCVAPPYVIQNVPPNIMIVLDNSGSMFNFAYPDGFETTATTDDRDCTATTDTAACAPIGTTTACICKGFTNPGTYPTYKYYGYFNSDYWYTYGSNKFTPSAPKTGSGLTGARAKAAAEWDGNFLNWLTIRRVDIIRKVMAGGWNTGSGLSTRLLGENADYAGRGIYKSITTAENYTQYSGNRTFTFSTGTGTSSFSVSGGGSFNVDVIVALPGQTASQVKVEGVLQRAVGAKARIGLSFYRPNTSATTQGGYVQTSVAGTALSAIVNQINNVKKPDSNTPLAETLWMVTGYFAQANTMGQGTPEPTYNPPNTANAYTINNTNDPLNYGTGGQPVYRSCGKSFVLYITDGEPCADGDLPSSILNYAQGKSKFNCGTPNATDSCPATAGTFPETYSFPASTFPTCGAGGNVAGIEDVALYMHTTDLRSPTLGVNAIDGIQNLTLYVVFAFGKGSTLLKYAAINGGFEDSNGNNIPDLQSEWDNNGDGVPDTYYEANDGAELETSIESALSTMLKRASSGTAASVLASGEGRGANLLQAVFYPRRAFGNDVIGWTGSLQNLWYYVDPLFSYSNIREDTTADDILNLQSDYIIRLFFDSAANPPSTKAKRYIDSNGDGAPDSQTTTVKFEDIGNLWEAGKLLWSREVTGAGAVPRKIYTTLDGISFLSNDFSVANAATLAPYLQVSTTTDAENIIKYTHGEDITLDANADGVNDFRARTVTIGSDTHVWKLGDILDSTPKISSWVPLNKYDKVYNDNTYANFVATTATTTPPVNYKGRGMVFAGANDGMLHAFNLGLLEESWTGQGTYEKARLTGADLGKEMWAFIPKNALPYLKYIADPDYCHAFNVDLAPFIFDASIGGNASDPKPTNGSSWRTVLIGGMRTGGACRGTTTSCTDVDGDGSKDCVNTPVDVGGASIGYSSYFAIDITDQNNPQLLWEFSDPQLGFATTGPAIVRIGNGSQNGDWFVVFGSGPTGPISTLDTQFMGRSDQNLRLFIFNLKTGPGTNNANVTVVNTGIQYAFAGSMISSSIDTDASLNYMDDAVYIGYTKKNTADGAGTTANPYKWTQGGVGRLLTKEDPNPANWAWSIVMDNIGPVTSAVAKLESTKNKTLWLYFGTGRSYFATATSIDDQTNQRRLFGIKEPCFTSSGFFNLSCTTAATFSSLTDVTNITNAPSESTANGAGFRGWYINVDASGSYTYAEGDPAVNVTKNYGAERVITDTVSTTTGCVFYTSYKPYVDVCSIGGKSFLWAVRYNTGGSCALKGKALLQVSTGSIEQVNLADAFTNRKSAAMEGVPPTGGGLSLQTPPDPVKRIQHIRER